VAGQKKKDGKAVWAIPYDYQGACASAPEACLGVPYFNWIPGYTKLIGEAMSNKWQQQFLWLGPDWQAINDPATTTIASCRVTPSATARNWPWSSSRRRWRRPQSLHRTPQFSGRHPLPKKQGQPPPTTGVEPAQLLLGMTGPPSRDG